MRRTAEWLMLFAVTAPGGENPPVTVFFSFEQEPPAAVVEAMRSEVTRLYETVPLRFEWRRMEEAPESGVMGEIISVRFRGNCSLAGVPPLADERGTLAWTTVTDGQVQPFAEVSCDRVRQAVYLALWGGERKRGQQRLGTALGRVVAHELYHIYWRTAKHAGGVARHALTGAELVAERSELHPEDRR
jgi:hypothetical protein